MLEIVREEEHDGHAARFASIRCALLKPITRHELLVHSIDPNKAARIDTRAVLLVTSSYYLLPFYSSFAAA